MQFPKNDRQLMNKAYFLSPLTAKNFQWKMDDFHSFSEKTDFKFSINRELDVPSSVQSLTKKQMIANDKFSSFSILILTIGCV
ncbi:hypothetical protein C723_2581 [Christiangramia flava JLT2011]|uniref:Uncharacterized protein n=1 Tax=Christiangramia flava JLT2011 TaxID=1229726 RepID=A0A1L7I5P7_9FLAO|nr:hypothetical protein GRFL_2204 [Christiangramia flava JLT2011]OSS38598.1 hypothetical protein C723_2581 [Christiangramia flava JLT2011]